jgi:hypothetical protein
MKISKMTHERKIILRYMGELSATMILYTAVLVISIEVGRPMHPGLDRTLIELSPMIPVVLAIIVIARHFRRMDEYVRLRALESIAISFAVTAGGTFTYGFLENTGFPRLSMFTVWGVMGAVWLAVAIFRGDCRR